MEVILMADFRIFYVATAAARPGKRGEAAQWWREKGQAHFESLSGVKSLQVFASQFLIGRKHGYEFWYELENYAVLDTWDAELEADPQKYGPPWMEFTELFEPGPTRIMGDWPESLLV
jgi:hypothetical protein